MRNMLAFLAAAVIAVGAAGFYLGWFNIRSTPAANGHRDYTLDINTKKIGQDVHEAEQKIENKLHNTQDKATTAPPSMPLAEPQPKHRHDHKH